jgi:hypothetical protein
MSELVEMLLDETRDWSVLVDMLSQAGASRDLISAVTQAIAERRQPAP